MTPPAPPEPKIAIRGLSFFYGTVQALRNVSIDVPASAVTALIGPSGCGKTTLLRCVNRMNDLIEGGRREGQILVDGADVYDRSLPPEQLRKDVGMVFQRPNPFPTSIYKNVAYGPQIHGVKKGRDLDALVEDCLRKTVLWEEVKDSLHASAMNLSGGQQQRLCIARALAVGPKVLLMDEPCSALDPIATARIEDLMYDLKQTLTVVLVTHNMQQAQRASDHTAFMMGGRVLEFGATRQIFLHPEQKQTDDYISGRFG
ncbi:MAG TPA: phosphate ABC transporter ATP-binding protein PstB [Fimbriimonas sp.]|nr:phosphate ABC transporter ATP-binding protein PstB [Fimbriimonas sp.]